MTRMRLTSRPSSSGSTNQVKSLHQVKPEQLHSVMVACLLAPHDLDPNDVPRRCLELLPIELHRCVVNLEQMAAMGVKMDSPTSLCGAASSMIAVPQRRTSPWL